MTSKFGDLDQRRVLPDEYLVLRVTVCGDQFTGVLGPGQVANLGSRVHTVHRLRGQSVPETDATVRCAAATGQQSVVMRRPGDGFDGSHMLCVRLHRIRGVEVPDIESVIIATGRQLLIVRRPFEATDLLPVTSQLTLRHNRRRSHVALEDVSIPGSRGQDVPVPG